ncbi:MAG: PAS domain S-box protein, partial [Phycisphaeraceae bacterium]
MLSIATVATVAMVTWWRRRLLSRFDRRELPETKVQAAARRYRELVEDLDLIFWEGQLDEGFSFVSPQVVDLLGYPLEQWLDPRSTIIEKVVHPDDRARLERLCEKARESGEGYEIDFRLIAQDGTILWVHNLTRVIPTPDGNYLMHGVVVDVTDRRKAEEALRTSERRYRIAQNLSLDAFAILEPVFNDQGKIVDMRWEHANAAAARIWDRQPEQLRGQLWTEALPQTPQNQLLFSQYARVAENGIASDTEVSFHSKSVRGWVRSIAVRVDGSVAVSLSDISEKRMVEQALRESEQRFRTLADSAPVLIWLAGPDKMCTYVNRAWLELTGRTFEQELGTGWLENLHPDDIPATMETVDEAKSQRRPFRCEFRIRRHDGEYRWLISQGAPRFSPDGTFTGYVGSCVDITERKHAEQQLERRLDQQETVVELGQSALASKPLMPLMQHAAEEVAKTLDVDYCKVLRYDEQAHHFVLTAAVGFPQEAIGNFTVDADVSNQAGYTLQSASPVIVDDLRSESRFS